MNESAHDHAGEPTGLGAGLHAIWQTYHEANEAIQAMPDLGSAYESATGLAVAMRQMADTAALTRARMAARIRDAEGLSLAGLAAKLGMSKARADQLLKAARSG
ncbi:hypothetical protein ABZ297_36510 [Nonomuraea sp. NPDC005983]|uniref:hypothetical protein n=1 Tax=Nonomuraea sp. NPDC005983 TaxID=3155595 RepID=UPI0033A309B6